MFPIRCLVECVGEGECVKCGGRGTTVADSFAIVAGQTPLSQLVETVLAALGFQYLAVGARAWIQIKNWKPLTFDQITDDPDLEIEYILKDVSNLVTLRILTKQSDVAVADFVRDMKDRLLKMALQKVPRLLQEAAAFHPQLKDLIVQLAQGDTPPLIDAQQIHNFNMWLEEFASSNNGRPQAPYGTSASMNGVIVHQSLRSSHQNGFPTTPSSNSGQHYHQSQNHHHAPAGNVHHSTPGVTRFSPLLEVPKLERWFRENPNPSRQKLQYYMQILNGSNFRKHAGKITYQQICNWFINARASHRKKDGSGQGSPEASQVGATTEGRPNSAGDASPSTAGASASHWVSKVFSNNVRNLSIAFNDFIQSTPAKTTGKSILDGGMVAVNVAANGQSPSSGATNQNQGSVQCVSPSLDTSSTSSQSPTTRTVTGSRDVSINVLRDDGLPLVYKEEDEDEDGDTKMRVIVESSSAEQQESPFGAGIAISVSPSVSPISMNATLKAISDGLPTMAASNRLTNPSASASNSASAAAAAAFGAGGINRTRLMFDPLTELPMLEKWFEENPHPSWAQVDQYTEQLNSLSYRQTYPPVSSHNLKIWFKNRRAKCKRLMSGTGSIDGSILAISIKGEHT